MSVHNLLFLRADAYSESSVTHFARLQPLLVARLVLNLKAAAHREQNPTRTVSIPSFVIAVPSVEPTRTRSILEESTREMAGVFYSPDGELEQAEQVESETGGGDSGEEAPPVRGRLLVVFLELELMRNPR